MEAHGVRDFPAASLRGRFVRRALAAAVLDHLLPVFTEQVLRAAVAGQPLTRDMAARACVYLQARTGYGIVEPERLAVLRAIWTTALGARDLAALEPLFARLIWIADGELDALDPPRASTGRSSASPTRRRTPTGNGPVRRMRPARRAKPADASGHRPCPLAGIAGRRDRGGVRRRALGHARPARRGRELGALLEHAATPQRRRAGRARRGTGLPSGRIPDRGVNRPPYPDEIQQARRYATRLRQAMTAGTRTIERRTPGGRFDGRAYARGQAQRASGRPVSTPPVAHASAGSGRRSRRRTSRW